MDRGAWWATVQGVTKSQTWLSDWAQGGNRVSDSQSDGQRGCGVESDRDGMGIWLCLIILEWEKKMDYGYRLSGNSQQKKMLKIQGERLHS